MSDGEATGVFILGNTFGILLCIVVMNTTYTSDDKCMNHTELVEAGLAEFYLDENNNRQWRLLKDVK